MSLNGKGFYIWKIRECEDGNADSIVQTAKEAGLTHVLIKIANGIYAYNFDWDKNIDLVPPVAKALRDAGIEVWGWHYVYGDSPVSEAKIAIRRVQELNLDGYVIDAEAEYKESGKKTAAKQFMGELRGGLGNNVPIVLSSYRYPSLHPIPWNEFLEKCDYNMPQVYWIQSHNPGDQLKKSLLEFQSSSIKYRPPIIPTGAAFTEHNWEPTVSEITEFLETAKALNLSAANFWEWANCRERLTTGLEIWNTIANFKWESEIPPPKDITGQYIDALNTRNLDTILDLYTDQAVHVTASRTIRGKTAIRAWYTTFLNQILPLGRFERAGFSGEGNSRHLAWILHSAPKKVLNGNDTFGLSDGKISYHYTYFTIS